MSRDAFLKKTDKEILDIARQVRIAYQLKRTLRYAAPRDLSVHSESVAEHVFALFFLAEFFLPLEDPWQKMDARKIQQILLFHDFGEIVHGDIPYHFKTEADSLREQDDARMIFATLPEHLQKLALERWTSYEKKDSQEAHFAYALDKIEPLFELFDPISEVSLKRTKHTYEDHWDRKSKATKGFPVMCRFLDVVSQDMLSRDVFWRENLSDA